MTIVPSLSVLKDLDVAIIDPQFEPFLAGNDSPGFEVLNTVTKAKEKPLEYLQALQRDMRALEMVLESMGTTRDIIKKKLSLYDHILAPIRQLPDDILEEIFYHCLPTTRNARPFVSESPLLLTLVCKRWRIIAMSAPRLWTSLHIPVVFAGFSALVPQSALVSQNSSSLHQPRSGSIPLSVWSDSQSVRNVALDQWLRRSGDLSLSLSLYSEPGIKFPKEATESTIRLIAKYADRLSALEVDIPDTIMQRLDLAITDCFDFSMLPRLRKLRLSLARHSRTRLLQWLLKFISTKVLQELSISTSNIDTTLGHFSASITTLSIHTGITAVKAQHALRRLHQLEQCHLTIHGGGQLQMDRRDSSLEITAGSIHLPALGTLSVAGPLGTIQALCEALETPVLSNLQFYITRPNHAQARLSASRLAGFADQDFPYPPPSTEHLAVFLSQCTSLHSFTIDPYGVQAAELQSIFSGLAHIKHLVFNLDADPHAGSLLTNPPDTYIPPPTSLRYSLHPLLGQYRVSLDTDEPNHQLEEPLLPRLTSFTWNQKCEQIQLPNDLLVTFIKSRLHPRTHSSAGSPNFPPSTVSLHDIKIRFPHVREAYSRDIEKEIVQYAESAGLKRGVDFTFDVFIHPHPTKPAPRYVIPPGYVRSRPVYVSDDNLILEHDVTWPFVDI